MLFNKQQTFNSIAWKGYKYTFVNQADYTDIFALQLAPMLLVHLAGSFIIALCPRSLDYRFLKYGQLQLLKKKKKEYVLRQVLQIHSFFPVNTHGAHLYSHADVIAFYTSRLVAWNNFQKSSTIVSKPILLLL